MNDSFWIIWAGYNILRVGISLCMLYSAAYGVMVIGLAYYLSSFWAYEVGIFTLWLLMVGRSDLYLGGASQHCVCSHGRSDTLLSADMRLICSC